MKKRLLSSFGLLVAAVCLLAQSPGQISIEEYILRYKDISIEEMKLYRIPASITMAQAILESSNGNSDLARLANNHFGIKCKLEWEGETYYKDDDEKNECFRKYRDPVESFRDHSVFLADRDRYDGLFSLDIKDYKGWAYGLKAAGYATNPKYPQILIKIIEDNDLQELDQYYLEPVVASAKTKKDIHSKTKVSVSDDFEAVYIGANNRKVYLNNGVKFIYARAGDSFAGIAKDFEIYSWQVYKYNDLRKDDQPSEGQMLYLQHKKNKGSKPYHIAEGGDTMYVISQRYGVKLKKLYEYNGMAIGTEPAAGQKVLLRKPA
jgi:LysM repeat protein